MSGMIVEEKLLEHLENRQTSRRLASNQEWINLKQRDMTKIKIEKFTVKYCRWNHWSDWLRLACMPTMGTPFCEARHPCGQYRWNHESNTTRWFTMMVHSQDVSSPNMKSLQYNINTIYSYIIISLQYLLSQLQTWMNFGRGWLCRRSPLQKVTCKKNGLQCFKA